jgi:hypothetical protein
MSLISCGSSTPPGDSMALPSVRIITCEMVSICRATASAILVPSRSSASFTSYETRVVASNSGSTSSV